MNKLAKWFEMDVPAGWGETILRSVIVAVVAFVVLQAKELVDAGALDTPATAVDALLISGAYLIVNAATMIWTKPRSRRHSPGWQSD